MTRHHLVCAFAFFLLTPTPGMAQVEPLESGVTRWDAVPAQSMTAGLKKPFLKGSTTALAYLEVDVVELSPGAGAEPLHRHDDLEEMVIVKEGVLRVELIDETRDLGPGSVILALPGDAHGYENASDDPAVYYVFRYRGKAPMNLRRGDDAGSSQLVDWNEVEMNPNEKGGRRQILDRATTVFDRFEMHVTTLNEGLTSHDPHQHAAEEFILIFKSEVEEFIDHDLYSASAGDLIFLDSQSLHNISSTGTGPAEYFAFQWE